MEPRPAPINKLTRPDPSDTFPRERLFQTPDGAVARQVVWVGAPAGSVYEESIDACSMRMIAQIMA